MAAVSTTSTSQQNLKNQIEVPDGKENENTSASQPYFSVSSNGKFCIIKQMKNGSLPLYTSIVSRVNSRDLYAIHLMIKIDQIRCCIVSDCELFFHQLDGGDHIISCSKYDCNGVSQGVRVISDLFNRIARCTGQIQEEGSNL